MMIPCYFSNFGHYFSLFSLSCYSALLHHTIYTLKVTFTKCTHMHFYCQAFGQQLTNGPPVWVYTVATAHTSICSKIISTHQHIAWQTWNIIYNTSSDFSSHLLLPLLLVCLSYFLIYFGQFLFLPSSVYRHTHPHPFTTVTADACRGWALWLELMDGSHKWHGALHKGGRNAVFAMLWFFPILMIAPFQRASSILHGTRC